MGAAKQLQWALEKTPLYNTDMALPTYSKFETVEDFNREFEMSMAIHRKKFTKLQHKVLKVIRGYACVVPGVANARISIYQDECQKQLGHTVSRSTVRDTLDKAESLGILLKCHGLRFIQGHNSTSANVVVFNTYKEAYAYKIAKDKLDLVKAQELLADHYKSAHKMLNIYGEAVQIVSEVDDAKRKKSLEAPQEPQKQLTLYQRLIKAYKPKDEHQMAKFKELVSIVYRLIKEYKNKFNFNQSQLEQLMLESFDTLLNKDGVKNQAAMLSVIIRNKVSRLTTPYIAPQKAPEAPQNREIVPEWFDSRNDDRERREQAEQVKEQDNAIDFETAKKMIEEKLRNL